MYTFKLIPDQKKKKKESDNAVVIYQSKTTKNISYLTLLWSFKPAFKK